MPREKECSVNLKKYFQQPNNWRILMENPRHYTYVNKVIINLAKIIKSRLALYCQENNFKTKLTTQLRYE